MAVAALLESILDRLRARRDALDLAIVAMERLASTDAPRRGRKPRLLKDAEALAAGAVPAAAPKRRGRKPRTTAPVEPTE